MFDVLLKFFLFTTVTLYLPGMRVTEFDQKYFDIAVMILTFITPFCSKIRHIYAGRWLTLIGLNCVCLLNCFTHIFDSYVLSYTINVFLFSILIFIVSTYCKDFNSCIKWALYAFVVNYLVLIMQVCGFNDLTPSFPLTHPGGLMSNSPRLSFLACLLIPFAFEMNIGIFLMIIISQLFKQPQYGIFLIILVMIWFKYPKQWIRLLVILFVLILIKIALMYKGASISNRIYYYYYVLHDFYNYFLWKGFGVGIPFLVFSKPFWMYGEEIYIAKFLSVVKTDSEIQMLSSILQFFFMSGVTGILWFLFICKKFYKNFHPCALDYSLLGLMLISVFDYPLQTTRILFLVAVEIAGKIIQLYKTKT